MVTLLRRFSFRTLAPKSNESLNSQPACLLVVATSGRPPFMRLRGEKRPNPPNHAPNSIAPITTSQLHSEIQDISRSPCCLPHLNGIFLNTTWCIKRFKVVWMPDVADHMRITRNSDCMGWDVVSHVIFQAAYKTIHSEVQAPPSLQLAIPAKPRKGVWMYAIIKVRQLTLAPFTSKPRTAALTNK